MRQETPAPYLDTTDEKELAKHCLEGADKDFPLKVSPGDIIVAGRNFGCGSSREHAPLATIISPGFTTGSNRGMMKDK